MLDLTVVIVSYQVRERLKGCLESLSSLEQPSFDIVVVDNASNDATVETLAPLFPKVKFISMDRNTGFAMACNRGAQLANSPWVLFLNPDTVVFPDSLAKVLEFARATPKAGIVGCRILDGEGMLQLACRRSIPTPEIALWRLSGLSFLFPRNRRFARYNLTFLDPAEDAQVEAVSGSFMMIRTDLYRQLRGFDEQFFLYGEDLDLCLRVAKAGWEVWYHGKATIIHHKGRSAAARPWGARWDFYHAMVTFAVKNFGVGPVGKILLEGIAFILAGLEILVRRFRDIRSISMDLLLGNGLFFLVSTAYLSILADGISADVREGYRWIWQLGLSFWIVCSMGLAGAYTGHEIRIRQLMLGLGGMASGFLATGFFLKNIVFSRAVFMLATIVVVAMLLGRRLASFSKVSSPRRLLVLGAGLESHQLADRLRQWPQLYRVVGVMAESSEVGFDSTLSDFAGLPVADLSSLHQTVHALEIDALVLPGIRAVELLPLLPRKLPPGLSVQIEVPTESGPPLLGDVTLDRNTIAELK
jgi:O-antigen biosynthesis protein